MFEYHGQPLEVTTAHKVINKQVKDKNKPSSKAEDAESDPEDSASDNDPDVIDLSKPASSTKFNCKFNSEPSPQPD